MRYDETFEIAYFTKAFKFIPYTCWYHRQYCGVVWAMITTIVQHNSRWRMTPVRLCSYLRPLVHRGLPQTIPISAHTCVETRIFRTAADMLDELYAPMPLHIWHICTHSRHDFMTCAKPNKKRNGCKAPGYESVCGWNGVVWGSMGSGCVVWCVLRVLTALAHFTNADGSERI